MPVVADAAEATQVAIAAATLSLAVVTWLMAREAKRSVQTQRDAARATLRPFVFPVVPLEQDPDGGEILTFENGGPGPAFNVRAAIHYIGPGGASATLPAALAAGQVLEVKVAGEKINLRNAIGYLSYLDSGGDEWQTHFKLYAVPSRGGDKIVSEIVGAGAASVLGEPQYNSTGWLNMPGSPEVRWGVPRWRGAPAAHRLHAFAQRAGRWLQAVGERPQR